MGGKLIDGEEKSMGKLLRLERTGVFGKLKDQCHLSVVSEEGQIT